MAQNALLGIRRSSKCIWAKVEELSKAYEPSEEGWYFVDGVAKVWDGEKWRRFKFEYPPGRYAISGEPHYWDGAEWDVDASSGADESEPGFKQDWEYALEDWEVKEQSEFEPLKNIIKQDWEYKHANPITKEDYVFRTLAEEIEFANSGQSVKRSAPNPQLDSQDYATKLTSRGKDTGNSLLGCLMMILLPLIFIFTFFGAYAGFNTGGTWGKLFAIFCIVLFIGVFSQFSFFQAYIGGTFTIGGIGMVLTSFFESSDSLRLLSFGLVMGLIGTYFLWKMFDNEQ